MGLMDKIWDDVFAGPQPATDAQQPPAPAPSPKLRPTISIPHSPLARAESLTTTDESAKSPTEDLGRRSSTDYGESQSVRPSVSQRISITGAGAPPRRMSLDTAHSLPPGFRFMPDILSPGSRREDNVWRSVFNPGSNKAGMDLVGSSKFDKADPKGPSVYDWFYRASSRSQYR